MPIVKGKQLSADDRMRRDLIERLMCDLAVDLDEVALRHGMNAEVFAPDLEKLIPLAADGLARIDGHRITVPDEVRPLVRAVAAAFDPTSMRRRCGTQKRSDPLFSPSPLVFRHHLGQN